jgi:hypothetical protein
MRPVDGRDAAVKSGEIKCGTPVPTLSMTLPNTVRPKLRNKHFVGSADWIRFVQRRGGIEGSFGVFKSRAGIGFTKGYFAVGGQVQHAILGTIAFSAMNCQITEGWIARGGITKDPVYAPAPQMYGTRELTAEEDREERSTHLEEQERKVA